jgi:hypothetical protein
VKTNLDEEWQKLCDENDAARDAYFNASKVVDSKFAAVVKGTSRTNPTEEELEKPEFAWKAWEDIRRRMQEFVKRNTGGSD